MAEEAVVYVGSDERQAEAELALEYSIRKHASIPVKMIFMRECDPGPWADWRFNWQYQGKKTKKKPVAMQHTRFTCFRYSIPEIHGYNGRAIYMDSDMVMLRDIAELWRMPMKAPWKCCSHKRTCVSLIDTAPFRNAHWWPKVKSMRAGNMPGAQYRQILGSHGFLDETLPAEWNCPDGIGFSDKTAVLHFTTVETQPWQPWPEGVQYRPHVNPKMVGIWNQYHAEATHEKVHEDTPEEPVGPPGWRVVRDDSGEIIGFVNPKVDKVAARD